MGRTARKPPEGGWLAPPRQGILISIKPEARVKALSSAQVFGASDCRSSLMGCADGQGDPGQPWKRRQIAPTVDFERDGESEAKIEEGRSLRSLVSDCCTGTEKKRPFSRTTSETELRSSTSGLFERVQQKAVRELIGPSRPSNSSGRQEMEEENPVKGRSVRVGDSVWITTLEGAIAAGSSRVASKAGHWTAGWRRGAGGWRRDWLAREQERAAGGAV